MIIVRNFEKKKANESLLPASKTHPKNVLPIPIFQLLLFVPV